MSKYIDKGTTRQHLTDRLMESALNNVGIRADADEVFRDIAENRLPVWIDELLTYDVEEVRHGKWEDEVYTSWPLKVYGHKCSVCRTITPVSEGKNNYCPNCGAKMEGEEE